MTAGSSSPAGNLPAVPQFDYRATLAPPADLTEALMLPPGSWYITHPLGRPAGGTFTQVAFADDALADLVHATASELGALLEEVVRRVAVDLYGGAWAFVYRPDQYEQAIARWHMRRRELVIVTRLTVYTQTREDPHP